MLSRFRFFRTSLDLQLVYILSTRAQRTVAHLNVGMIERSLIDQEGPKTTHH